MNTEERLNELERKLNTLAWFMFYSTGKTDEHSVCKEVRLSESAYNQVQEIFKEALCLKSSSENKTQSKENNES